MKILFFTRYTRLGASSRLRFFQFFPYLRSAGISVDSSPLFNDQYLSELYGKKRIDRWNIIKSYFRRIAKLFKVNKYDLVVIEKELFPFLPAAAELILSFLNVKYIVDYDDAIFHNYDQHTSKWVRHFLGNKIETVMRCSSLVVAGNAYLENYAVKSGSKKVVIIPTVIDTGQYQVKVVNNAPEVIIGWIGSPSTLKYVEMLRPILQEIKDKYPIKLHIVGGKAGVGLDEIEEVFEWSEETEVELIRRFDIGIMPLRDQLWEYGKCGYKLIQYMGCGVPVVGSPIGVNNIIIQEGVNGFKPKDAEEWKKALEGLIVDQDLRMSMGKDGRRRVEENYSINKASETWLSLISGIV